MLQKHRAKFYREEVTKLCSLEEESTTYLLVLCPTLSHKQESMLQTIYQQLEAWEMTSPGTDDLIQILLGTHRYTEDPTSTILPAMLALL